MGEYQRNSRRERKPARRFDRDFAEDRPRRRFSSRPEGRFRRDDDRSGRPEMHSAVCDECGKECTVPFRPTSSKPVYCSDCFRKRGSSSSRSGHSSEDFERINQKLDKIMQALKIR